MAEPKTKPTDASVEAFLAAVPDDARRTDAHAVCALLTEVTGTAPVMWGDAIVGFGLKRYENGQGKTVEWFPVGFSPRKQQTVVYLLEGFERHTDLLARLGRHSTGRACLYVKRLSDVDTDVLAELVRRAWTAG
ncbi:DUF1801 domain-containing protein [Kineosporia sp. A_224]|uniref:DUF1801 domain-containing protein n=1 Tax=Kineosporia sp. A_224 TaxID=1962180 RepID=UPI000B4BAAD3|nr:DUF1801 domain-containing protein [Kineosporia sp. A_224]